MFSHVTLGANDMAKALAFYDATLAVLGLIRTARDEVTGAVGYGAPSGGKTPMLFVGAPIDGAPAAAGNGLTIAFEAQSREQVIQWRREALAAGGSDAGAPGLRQHYHASYFGAYVRDPEGNKLCCVCHRAA